MSGAKTWKIAMSIVTLVVCLAYSIASAVAAKCMTDGKPCMTTAGVAAGCCGIMGAACAGLTVWYSTRGGGGGL